jgi:HAD superfamily hydrolase (TIGR01549 family)
MINTLIFDFGNVLLPIDEESTLLAFEELKPNDSFFETQKEQQLFEVGESSKASFLESLRPHFARTPFKPDLAKAWNAMITEAISEKTINFIKDKTTEYSVFLLSNTNILHIERIRERSGPFLYAQFIKCFDKVYYSHEIGLRKPDLAIFEHLLNEQGLSPESCLFIDDKIENIEGAKKAGMHVWHFNPHKDNLKRGLDKVLSALRD